MTNTVCESVIHPVAFFFKSTNIHFPSVILIFPPKKDDTRSAKRVKEDKESSVSGKRVSGSFEAGDVVEEILGAGKNQETEELFFIVRW